MYRKRQKTASPYCAAMRGRLTSGPAPLSRGERRNLRPLGPGGRMIFSAILVREAEPFDATKKAERNVVSLFGAIPQNRASLGHSQFLRKEPCHDAGN